MGTLKTEPHFLHFAALPARASFTLYFVPHEQTTAIGMISPEDAGNFVMRGQEIAEESSKKCFNVITGFRGAMD